MKPKVIKIRIPITEEEIICLQKGESYTWRVDSLTSKHIIDIHFYQKLNIENNEE